MTVRIKICGITRKQDAHAAVAAGADAVGFIFHAASPRYVEPAAAESIVRSLPPFVTTVGVFVDAEIDAVTDIVRRVSLDLVQLHGHESSQYTQQLALPFIRAMRVQPDTDIRQQTAQYRNAKAILLDAYVQGTPGGTGRQFAWSAVPDDLDKPIILAGGLNAKNVGAAISQVQPYAVDVSSGVESEPGIKEHAEIDAFVAAVRGSGI